MAEQASSTRMSASQRRDQLVEVAKSVFAELGYAATSVEEIAARAGVSKPIVYEHFGGKEGIYAVVVDREATRLMEMISARISPDLGARRQVLGSALAFLDYIEADPHGFRVLTRDAPPNLGNGMAGLLSDVAVKAEGVLAAFFAQSGLPVQAAPLYAHALVGMVVSVGSWWAKTKALSKQDVAAHLTALAYLGLSRLPEDPRPLASAGAPAHAESHPRAG